LETLSADTEASVNLCVLDNLVVVYIDHVHSQKHTLRTFTRLGARAPAYATGVGKVFLSQMKPDELKAYLAQVKMKRFTKNTITDHKTMAREIERVQKQGYAVDQQERENGVRCIAAPICDHKGSIVAAVSISGATQFITFKRVKPLSGLIRNTAARISAELGYKHSRSV
jgi:DNA-binding IclR family transcriptional regulator